MSTVALKWKNNLRERGPPFGSSLIWGRIRDSAIPENFGHVAHNSTFWKLSEGVDNLNLKADLATTNNDAVRSTKMAPPTKGKDLVPLIPFDGGELLAAGYLDSMAEQVHLEDFDCPVTKEQEEADGWESNRG
jgi:hypothetical protein